MTAWPADWSARYSGAACSMCAANRPEEGDFGIRILAGRFSDAYLQRANVQRGYTLVIWRGSHVVEPTELEDEEASTAMRGENAPHQPVSERVSEEELVGNRSGPGADASCTGARHPR